MPKNNMEELAQMAKNIAAEQDLKNMSEALSLERQPFVRVVMEGSLESGKDKSKKKPPIK